MNNDSINNDSTELRNHSIFTLVYSDNGGCFPENIDFNNPDTLGLQLVKALVEQIDGTVELEKGEKTKFTIRFEDKGFSGSNNN
ncbi:hypothetical protein SDC9_96551 [bioreactor metagenome]|uniref:Histidine kinase/HSP90-like ATPase domain-containing protein n=1 Tax=bioreactor metagenome TaxID=1076179 RepID=A0A645A9F7_9ZZZZ